MRLDSPRIMYVFPGQGSQYPGMGSDLVDRFPVARDVYAQASDTLGFDVARMSFTGSAEELGRTRNTQPVLLTHHIACLEVFRELTNRSLPPTVTAGHSLGEYAALVAAGALEFSVALRLVQERGRLMGEHGQGEMLAFPLSLEQVRDAADKHYCGIGGCNLEEQTVVGGRPEDLARVREELERTVGAAARRATPLKTEGAFHTYLMIRAAEAFRSFLEEAQFKPQQCRVLSNYTGNYHSDDASSIRSALFFQLFHPVKWVWGVHRALRDGVDVIVELGGGIGDGDTPATKRPNLASITKRTIKRAAAEDGTELNTLYLPAINVETITETASSLLAGVDVASENKN
jgi:[acyl-carrier-protein] S-malonyltransferase